MSIVFWINDECVLSQDGVFIHPQRGERVHLCLVDHQGYYRVKDLIWSYRTIPVGIEGKPPMQDDRLEVHLVKTK